MGPRTRATAKSSEREPEIPKVERATVRGSRALATASVTHVHADPPTATREREESFESS